MQEKLNFVQRLVRSLPGRWGSDMEAESRKWIVTCGGCKSGKSLWEHGGVRWKAAGKPSVRLECASCGRITWHSLSYQEPE